MKKLCGLWLLLCLGLTLPALAEDRYVLATITTASVDATSSLDVTQAIPWPRANVAKLKVTRSVPGGTAAIAFYQRATRLDADLVYSTEAFSGTYVDPVEKTTNLERNQAFLFPYQDYDSVDTPATAPNFFIKITNNDSQAKTFTILIYYEPSALVYGGTPGYAFLQGGTTPQRFRIYGTTTGPKYVDLKHDGTNFVIDLSGGGAVQLATGHLNWYQDNSFDIGASGANRPRNIYIGGSYYGDGSQLTGVSGAGGSTGGVVAYTANHTVSATEMGGYVLTNEGATGAIVFTLPACTASVPMKHVRVLNVQSVSGRTIKVYPASGEQIMVMTGAANKALLGEPIENDSLYLICGATGKAYVLGVVGNWAPVD